MRQVSFLRKKPGLCRSLQIEQLEGRIVPTVTITQATVPLSAHTSVTQGQVSNDDSRTVESLTDLHRSGASSASISDPQRGSARATLSFDSVYQITKPETADGTITFSWDTYST